MLAFFRESRFFGQPVELYQFRFGPLPGDVFRYTDGEKAVVYGGETYRPFQIKRGVTSNSGTLDKSTLEIAMPHNTELPELFRVYPPGNGVSLTILQGEARDPDSQFVAIWVGRVISCGREGIEAKLTGEPISTTFRRSGLRRNYQYMCPHVLYGPQCRASKAAATTEVTADLVNGRTVTLTSLLASQSLYVGGLVEYTSSSGLPESRTIIGVSTAIDRTVLTLTGIASGLLPGASLSAIRGCKHTMGACATDHNNVNNFGGMPWIPLKNPIGNVSPYQ